MNPSPATAPSTSIRPDAVPGLAAHWLPALVWNALFGPVGVLAYQGRLESPNRIVDLVLVGLALLGPLLLLRAAVETARALRFRGIRLEPDPPVASPGGEVGGTVVLPGRVRRDTGAFRMQLHCLRRERQGGSARDRVVWSREFEPRVTPGHRATRLTFAVPVDPSLPAGHPGSGDVRWVLRVTGHIPGLDLDTGFTLPVHPADEPAASSIPVVPETPPGSRDFDTRGVSVRRDAGALLLRFGAGRSLGMGVGFGAFGAMFLGGATFMAVSSGLPSLSGAGAFELALGAVSGLFFLVFGLVGLAFLLGGVWLATNRLDVEVRPDRIRTRRRILWFIPAGGTEVEVASVERLEARVASQSGQGARAAVGYRMVAHTPSGRVTLGDGIRGAGLLHRLGRLVERETGLTLEVPVRAGSGKAVGGGDPPGR